MPLQNPAAPMIISASRRTDIPSFFSDWFLERTRQGYVLMRNPMDGRMVTRISLDPADVDCIVFWTKDPRPLLPHLAEIRERYEDRLYIQFTVTPYDASVETDVSKKACLIESFRELSQLLGPHRVIWRYDPIFLTASIDLAYHRRWFAELAARLGPHTERCVISLLDFYRKTERNMAGLGIHLPAENETRSLLAHLADVAARHNIQVEACAEQGDFASLGIRPGKCVDNLLVSRITGRTFSTAKDRKQRATCGCIPSIDIGSYNTCLHGCRYCYANENALAVRTAHDNYDPASPLLCDRLDPTDTIKDRPICNLLPL